MHGYWQLDLCVIAFQNGFHACPVVVKEPPQKLPAPIGVEYCPYVGCSEDPNYQLAVPGLTESGRKGWSQACRGTTPVKQAKGGRTSE